MFTNQSETPMFDFTAYPLPGESIAEMEKHTKYDAGQEQAHFNLIANNYDNIMKAVGYPDPELIAQKAEKIAGE